ncbi:MAG: alpha/beta fold hydrolase [Pseudomonadota bacterium]
MQDGSARLRKALSAIVGLIGAAAAIYALTALEAGRNGLQFDDRLIDGTPVRIIMPADADGPAPTVVIAHGFAGVMELMEPFAVSLARAGYVTFSFDFVGHGSHPTPLPTAISGPGGAAAKLIAQLNDMVGLARSFPGANGQVALLGHSMATDLIAKAAADGLKVDATIAVSLFSPDVTATSPGNMLIIVGGLEDGLTDEALRVTALTAGGPVEEGVTYGSFDDGTARRTVFADGVEHLGVLFDPESLDAARDWLDRAFARSSPEGWQADVRGPMIGLLFGGLLAFGWGLAGLTIAHPTPIPAQGAGVRPGVLLALVAGPMLVTPVLATLTPTGLLPLILGDYLGIHFFIYGAATGIGLLIAGRLGRAVLPAHPPSIATILSGLAAGVFVIAAFAITLDRYAYTFVPDTARLMLAPALFAALLPWFLADEWLTRGVPDGAEGRGRRLWVYALTKICFVVSLGLAVALDTERLFFLLIVAPVILAFFIVYGLISQRLVAVTGSPVPAAIALSAALAWSIAATFPRIIG